MMRTPYLRQTATVALYAFSCGMRSVRGMRAPLYHHSRRRYYSATRMAFASGRHPIRTTNSLLPSSSSSCYDDDDKFFVIPRVAITSASSPRLFYSSSNNNNNSNNNKGIFEKASNAVKSVLPSNWFGNTKKSKLLNRNPNNNNNNNDVGGMLGELLKDAPMPVRIMGNLFVKPMIGGLVNAISEQNQRLEDYMDEAILLMKHDENVLQSLSSSSSLSFKAGMPFSQSSSSTTINGRSSLRLQASFEVVDSFNERQRLAIANMVATENGIEALRVEMINDGRIIQVNLSPQNIKTPTTTTTTTTTSSFGTNSGLGRNPNMDDNVIIDAEFVEKKKE